MPSVAVRKQASWLTRDPILTKDGEVQTIEPDDLTPNDIDTLLYAHQFYLSPDFAAALTGRTTEAARRRFKSLKRQDPPYLEIAAIQRAKPKRFWNETKYVVTSDYALKLLKKRDINIPLKYPHSSSFDHDVLANRDIMSAIVAQKRNCTVFDLLLPDDLVEILPDDVDRKKAWFDFPLHTSIEGQNVIRPDYYPIGIERHFDPDNLLFFVLELETGSNHIPQSNYENSNLGFKVLAWLDVLKHDTYNKRLALPNLYIVFSLVHPGRSVLFRDMLKKLVPKEFQQYFLFRQHPIEEPIPKFPTKREEKQWQRKRERENYARLGYFLEEDFERVGSTFNFMTSRE